MLIERCLCGGCSWTQTDLRGGRGRMLIASCLNCGTKWLVTNEDAAAYADWYASGRYHDDEHRHAGVIPYKLRYDSDRLAARARIARYRERLPAELVPNDSAIYTYLLDVGAANGAFVDEANQNGYCAVGIDADPRFVRAGGDIMCGTITSTALQHGYEVITYHDVLEHLADPRAELRVAAHRLAPGGCIVIEVPDVHVEAGDKHFKREHLWYFTMRTLADVIRDVGLNVTGFDFPIPGKMAVFACRPR